MGRRTEKSNGMKLMCACVCVHVCVCVCARARACVCDPEQLESSRSKEIKVSR